MIPNIIRNKTNINNFISIWCPQCGEHCMLTVYGAKCFEHGLMIVDYHGLRFINSILDILLSYEECGYIINDLANRYDFD